MSQKQLPELRTPLKNKVLAQNDIQMKEIKSPQKAGQYDLLQEITKDKSNAYSFLCYQPSNRDSLEQQESIQSDYQSINQYQQSRIDNNPQKFNTVKKSESQYLMTNIKQGKTESKQNSKGCNCKHSKCLKNYCECLKYGNVCCESCSCLQCQNVKITSIHIKNIQLSQQKSNSKALGGCRCKNSNCLKNYCECHQGKKKCGKQCKCKNCQNMADQNDQDSYEQYGNKKIKISDFEGTQFQQNKQNLMFSSN